ncbi:MAG TPA: hypothetical protein PKG54_12090 [Phycisphaerae bacterium]|jgi:hypothetical protein|nr:hypothetical protein [Phycisphaerae bacterium]HOB75251.1 hypothetical protein [Phycisphaerae bacterium]HOJ55073.1 hypothetical protein [Phycisphaerae bacterium]HOL24915.1 hypothetical protein [Phycisphaerae bacterium]HPP22871.1 hypothetical protein [Phycisphaerae bacterium]
MRKMTLLTLAALAVAVSSAPLWGQAQQESARGKESPGRESLSKLREATRTSPLFWDVQTIIDQYVKVMSSHYQLTENQEQYTRELMNRRVKQFLKEYEKDVRTLMSEYYDYQLRREMPSPEAARDFAARATPLITAIRQEILDGNMQWRRILNDEQLKKHDRDLEMIHATFDNYEGTMKRWAEGDVHPTDVGIRERNPARNVIKVEDAMGYYVRNFINQYNLDQGQRETAYSILREAREEAGRYRESHKAEFAELEARQKELAASNPDKEEDLKRIKEEGRKLTERRAELEKPLTEELFARFKERLDTIPTADQRAAYEARQTALKERLAKLRQSARTATLPAGVGTRPAGTQPADEVAATPTGE